MTEIINATVTHKSFGKGKVQKINGGYVIVSFDDEVRKFVYPEAFKRFLSLKDSQIAKKVDTVIEKKEIEDEKDKKIKEEAMKARQLAYEIEEAKSNQKSPRAGKVKKANNRRNIAFKINYCDGGQTNEKIGFDGICSDELIEHNIKKERYPECSHSEGPCYQYLNVHKDREKLDGLMNSEENVPVCYESQILRSWKASAGENADGKTRKIRSAHLDTLGILTTRLPTKKENERLIFGLFMVDDLFEGSNSMSGYVACNSKYKVSLSLEEAQHMRFWDYYQKDGNKRSAKWGSGLFRYIEDDKSVDILKDLVKLKEGSPEEEQAQEFLDYYCKKNFINLEKTKLIEEALKNE